MTDEYRELQEIHSTLNEIKKILPSLRPDWSWAWIIVVFWFFFSGWPGSRLDRWTDRVWYSFKNNAKWENTDIQKRPSDCDLLHAPIGSKGCYYKKKNSSFTDSDRSKLLETATTPEDRTRINNIPNSVTVYWEKTAD
ncbi:MAG TPA: hypothetical protein VJW20_22430 [Candidatus Angelobacter sp.]|nr:hypothetical protein [Candidatus Angelobacter sp.]